MPNEAEPKRRDVPLSPEDVRRHSPELFGLIYRRLMEIPEAKAVIEETEYSEQPSDFSFDLGPWQFKGKINLYGKEITIVKKIPDYSENDGEFDQASKFEIDHDKISYTYSVDKVDSDEPIRVLESSTNTREALSQAYYFNIELGEIPPRPEGLQS